MVTAMPLFLHLFRECGSDFLTDELQKFITTLTKEMRKYMTCAEHSFFISAVVHMGLLCLYLGVDASVFVLFCDMSFTFNEFTMVLDIFVRIMFPICAVLYVEEYIK